MSDALARIETDFQDFREAVERCKRSKIEGSFSAADWKDAYERLYRLLNRYDREKGSLEKRERAALSKAFESDAFIRGLLIYRVIGSHIQSDVAKKHDFLTIRDASGAPIRLDCETSALAMFAGSIVTLDDMRGRKQRIDHLSNLEKAERRIAAAFDNRPI